MFGFFGKRKPKTALDALIIQIYGSLDHKKTANLDTATNLAFEALLCTAIDYPTVRKKAEELFSGKIPYSTNDLALSVALSFFQDQHNRDLLSEADLPLNFHPMAIRASAEFALLPFFRPPEGRVFRPLSR